MPVLLTRMSSGAPPSPASRPANNLSRSPSTPSLARIGKARPPACSIDAVVCFAASSLLA
jgi:hypothetical protein